MKYIPTHHTPWLTKTILLLMVCYLTTGTTTAKTFYGYTKERPLIIVCDWDFQPFEFLNNEGKPAGYNVEVLDVILNRLEIPHQFVMQEWYLATEMFDHHEADLIHALSFYYKGHPYVMTKKYINYYNLKVARKQDTPPLHKLSQLTEEDILLLKQNDYAAMRINEIGDYPYTIEYHSPKEALTGIRSGRFNYFIWGEVPLTRKVQELSLDSIAFDEIDIPSGELRMIGYDSELIDVIDDEYTRLEENGELAKISNKWFHPERANSHTSPLALIILLGLLVAGIIAFLLSRLITLRVKAAVSKTADLNNMMKTALTMGDYYVTEHDLKTGRFKNVYGHLLPETGLLEEELISRIDQQQQEDFRRQLNNLKSGASTHFTTLMHWNSGTPEVPILRDLECTIFSETENGVPRYLVNTIKDITREVIEEHDNQTLWNKYMQMFNTNIVGLSFYSKDGVLLDLNEKMREICEFDEEGERYFRSANLFEVPTIKEEFDPKSHATYSFCQHMYFSELKIDKYVEMRIKPVFDDTDVLTYYIISARDITEERYMYLEQRHHNIEIKKTNEAIREYENQLGYLLERCKMFIWYYDPKTDNIQYTRTPRERQFTETKEGLFARVNAKERQETLLNMRKAIKERRPFYTIHHYDYTPTEPHPGWYAISGIPSLDKDGNLTEYFGISRNISDLMEAQEKLKEETARAENSGRLKAAFLANMTHEIRTPLNAIVGFSDILQMVETPEERMEFIRIIRNNCDMLLRLINDILEASSMGQALAIEPVACDFSQVFNDICQTLEQRVAEAGVLFIKDNPYESFPVTLDKGRVQQVLTNFTTNAVKYTKTGHIKVGYREQDGGIYFYCEDTGAGIPKDKQAAVFERFVKLNDFVQGTGLGLSICKSIAERCGGKIGVTSEGEGHGSTFWMWTPREIAPKS